MSTTTLCTAPGTPVRGGASSGVEESGTELRRHRRARAAWPARLLNKAGHIIAAMVCDISEGGLGLLAPANLPLGTLLDITLSVPKPQEPGRTQAVRATVRVVFSSFVGSQCRIGVQFVELPMSGAAVDTGLRAVEFLSVRGVAAQSGPIQQQINSNRQELIAFQADESCLEFRPSPD